MKVYIVEYSSHYESYIGGVFFQKEAAEKHLNELMQEIEKDPHGSWNGGEVYEMEVR